MERAEVFNSSDTLSREKGKGEASSSVVTPAPPHRRRRGIRIARAKVASPACSNGPATTCPGHSAWHDSPRRIALPVQLLLPLLTCRPDIG